MELGRLPRDINHVGAAFGQLSRSHQRVTGTRRRRGRSASRRRIAIQSRFAASAGITVSTSAALRATARFATRRVSLQHERRFVRQTGATRPRHRQINGVDVSNRVKTGSLNIHDAINHEINTARMLFIKQPPTAPQPLGIR